MNTLQTRDSGSLVTVDPYRCRIWALNIRTRTTEASCHAEIESFARNGQLVPLLGRAVTCAPECDVEVICGERRLFVARHLKIPLLVELRELTDRQAAVIVAAENSLRKSPSPYETGLWLAKLLQLHVYGSHDEMARELGIASSKVTRLLRFAKLPATIISAFSSPHDIRESWAAELYEAWNDERRRPITDRADALAKRVPRPPAISVYETLMAARVSANRRAKRGVSREIKCSTEGPLLHFERRRDEVILRIPSALIDTNAETTLTRAVVAVLTRADTVRDGTQGIAAMKGKASGAPKAV